MPSSKRVTISPSAQSQPHTEAVPVPKTRWYKYPALAHGCHSARIHSAFIAQVVTLVIALSILEICTRAQLHDLRWNNLLRTDNGSLIKKIEIDFKNSTVKNSSWSPELVLRDRREFKVSLIIQAYVISVICLHLLNYWILREVNYRITFSRFFNVVLILVCTSSLLLILEATLGLNVTYDALGGLAIFDRCQFGSPVPNLTKRISPVLVLTPEQREFQCHRYGLRFTAIALTLFASFIMLGIVLFARTEPDPADEAAETAEDLLDKDTETIRIHLILPKTNDDQKSITDTESLENL